MVELNNFEIFSVSIDLIILLMVTLTLVKFHTGDCRGMIVSKIKSPDGQLVTREAKLSMHEFHQDESIPLAHDRK